MSRKIKDIHCYPRFSVNYNAVDFGTIWKVGRVLVGPALIRCSPRASLAIRALPTVKEYIKMRDGGDKLPPNPLSEGIAGL